MNSRVCAWLCVCMCVDQRAGVLYSWSRMKGSDSVNFLFPAKLPRRLDMNEKFVCDPERSAALEAHEALA